MSDIENDKAKLLAVVACVRTGGNAFEQYMRADVSNSIVRRLDALGLDGYWFVDGPYCGWLMGPDKDHWAVVDREKRCLTASGDLFVEALELLVAGSTDSLLSLWRACSKVVDDG